jgi:hypothetical protein
MRTIPPFTSCPKATVWLLILLLNVAFGSAPVWSEEPEIDEDAEESRWAFLKRDWYEEQGIELPLQFGVSFNYIYMERDIEVTDVTVNLPNRPPESISDRADFDVQNRTSLTVARHSWDTKSRRPQAEATSFATEGYQFLIMAGFT